jgi:hypothetical protein
LNATSFNQSKRIGPTGRQHWPSTETIQRVLDATNTTWSEFGHLVEAGLSASQSDEGPASGLIERLWRLRAPLRWSSVDEPPMPRAPTRAGIRSGAAEDCHRAIIGDNEPALLCLKHEQGGSVAQGGFGKLSLGHKGYPR